MMLDVKDVHACYGKSHILQGIALNVDEGETVTLLGRNGAGKSTTLKTIAGVVAPTGGTVTFAAGRCRAARAPDRRARPVLRAGASRDFPPAVGRGEPAARCAPRFTVAARRHLPDLPAPEGARRNGGAQLSGGEQQMLAIGRALMNHPRLLMLDEPVEGLAPVIVEEIVEQLKQIKAAGVAILLVEQNLEVCTQLADRHFVIEQGVIVYEGSNAAFAADHEVKDRYLGVGVA